MTAAHPAAPAAIHRWSWAIVAALGLLLQTLYLTSVISGWRADADAARRDHDRRISELERSEREANNIPGRLDQQQDRIARLEARDVEALKIDRQTNAELARLGSEVRGVGSTVAEIAKDVRDLRDRRQTGQFAPSYNLPPSAPAAQRPGDNLPGFRP